MIESIFFLVGALLLINTFGLLLGAIVEKKVWMCIPSVINAIAFILFCAARYHS